jgi:hypothetical protein
MSLAANFSRALLLAVALVAPLTLAAEEGNKAEKPLPAARDSAQPSETVAELTESEAAAGGESRDGVATPLRPGTNTVFRRPQTSSRSLVEIAASRNAACGGLSGTTTHSCGSTTVSPPAGVCSATPVNTTGGRKEMGPSKVSAWISRTVPGLEDHGGRVVKRANGLTQMTMTPEDISNPDPQPGDVPWAGSLGWSESWYAFDNRSLNAFQIYLGILGPYSLADSFQVQIHDWINADEPLGWDNQLETEPLLNLN